MLKIIVLSLSLLFSVQVFAKSETLAKPSVVSQTAKTEVVEFFSFGCPHCYTFEPALDSWKAKHPDILFKKVAIGFNQAWKPLQKLFFTLEELKEPESTYKAVFTSLHVDHQNLFSDAEVVKWAVAHGFEKDKFVNVYTSFSVKNKVNAADQLAKQYDIQSVPSVAVNGKYMVYMDGAGPEGFLSEVEGLAKRK